MEFPWKLRKEFFLVFNKIYLIYFWIFSNSELVDRFCFWWVSTSGCCFSKDKQHRTRISVSEWGLRKIIFFLSLICLFTSEHLFSPLMGHFQTSSKKKGVVRGEIGVLIFQENWLEFSWVPFYCRSTFFIIIKKVFFPLELFLEGNLPCSVPF